MNAQPFVSFVRRVLIVFLLVLCIGGYERAQAATITLDYSEVPAERLEKMDLLGLPVDLNVYLSWAHTLYIAYLQAVHEYEVVNDPKHAAERNAAHVIRLRVIQERLASASFTIKLVSHEFFVKHSCGGEDCKVYGWFPWEAPRDTLYLDHGFDFSKPLASSVAVHEIVHFIQSLDPVSEGAMKSRDCEHAVLLEREAYAVQRDYIARAFGVYQPVGLAMLRVSCDRPAGSASQ